MTWSSLGIEMTFLIPSLRLDENKLDQGIITRRTETERILFLLYIHVYADGPTLPLWAGRMHSDSAWLKPCSIQQIQLYNAKAWASHAQQLTCWEVCCSKPSLMGESGGQQSAGIQYCTSIRPTFGGKREGKERKSKRDKEDLQDKSKKKKEKQRRSLEKNKKEREIRMGRESEEHIRGNPQSATDWDATTPHQVFAKTTRNRKGQFLLELSSWPE